MGEARELRREQLLGDQVQHVDMLGKDEGLHMGYAADVCLRVRALCPLLRGVCVAKVCVCLSVCVCVSVCVSVAKVCVAKVCVCVCLLIRCVCVCVCVCLCVSPIRCARVSSDITCNMNYEG